MKKGISSLVFIIPMIILTIAVIGVFGYKLYSDQSATRSKASEMPLEAPKIQESVKKPKTGYGSIAAPTAVPTLIPSPTTAPTAAPTKKTVQGDLENQLLTTEDDGGAEDMNALKNEAATL